MVVIVLGTPSGKCGDWGRDKLMFSFFAYRSLLWRKLDRLHLSDIQKCPALLERAGLWILYLGKLAKWAKFVLVLTNTHMLKKSRTFANRISKARQATTWKTTSNWKVTILNEATSKLNSCVKYPDSFICFFVVFNTTRIGPYCNTKPESLILERKACSFELGASRIWSCVPKILAVRLKFYNWSRKCSQSEK